ncbi:phospholipase B1, membrane-associated-like [Musca vetustissima]|uniref:phospholipase B1, membrane-associated-like n=1 Tax=Musca vetustissima TaxID=27455 RepID=UPI002AB6AA8B|nr:phospholipase B1, membrane-associated-like [Musca vetustissima]
MGRSGKSAANLNLLRRKGRTQLTDKLAKTTSEFCDINGAGKRSAEPPKSVHRLRPGDIDIVAAMGDSLTAGNGILGTNLLHLVHENRGASWSIGGQGTWREYLTLPNLLKEYNPKLYGYALGDAITAERDSRFNVAELGAMSRDMPYMAKVLVKRLLNDPDVNMTHHWKLLTLMVGNNDYCSEVCYMPDPMKAIDDHERNMLKTYRYLRDNVPRLMLNVAPAPNLLLLTKQKQIPAQCQIMLTFECPCIFGKSAKYQRFMGIFMDKWAQRDIEVARREEFNTETFTINIEHYTNQYRLPTLANGNADTTYTSEDCFHISQKAQAASAHSYWNNLFEMPEEKRTFRKNIYENFLCPTEEHPYIITRVNSRNDFKI